MTRIVLRAALLSLCLVVPGTVTAQEEVTEVTDAALASAIMGTDEGGPDAGAAAETGWLYGCTVERAGAAVGSHYVALTCGEAFTNRWHVLDASQEDAMLATALAAMATEKRVQVFVSAAGQSSYNRLLALYVTND